MGVMTVASPSNGYAIQNGGCMVFNWSKSVILPENLLEPPKNYGRMSAAATFVGALSYAFLGIQPKALRLSR